MAENPIKTSDLIEDDGAIKKLTEALKGLDKQLKDLGKTAGGLKKTMDGLNATNKDHQEPIKKAAAETDKLAKAQARLKESQSELGKQLANLKVQQQEQNNLNKLTAKLNNATKGSYNALSAQYSLNKIKLNNLSAEYRRSNKEGRKLEKQTREIFEEMNRLQKATGKATLQVGQYERAQSKVTVATNNAFKSLLRLSAAYIGLSAAANKVRDAVDITKKLESTDKALKAVVSDSKELAITQEFLQDISQRYGAEILSLTDSYVKFSAATKGTILEGEATRDIFDKVTKVSALLGLSSDETTGALRALGQMMSKGKVQAEELRGQLGDRIPGAFNLMAKAMGVTLPQLDELLKQGKVIAKDVLPAFADELEKAFGADKIENITTLQAAMTNTRNAFTELVKEIRATQFLKDLNQSLTDFIRLVKNNLTGIKNTAKFLALAGAAYLSYRASVLAATLAEKLRLVSLNRLIARQGILTTVTSLTTKATKALSLALKTSPIGIVTTLLATAATAFLLFKDNTDDATSSLDGFNKKVEKLESLTADKLIERIRINAGTLVKTFRGGLVTMAKFGIGLGEQETLFREFSETIKAGSETTVQAVFRALEQSRANLRVAIQEGRIVSSRESKQELDRMTLLLNEAQTRLNRFEKARDKSKEDPFKIRALRIKEMESGIQKEFAILQLSFDKNKALFEENSLETNLLVRKFENDKERIRDKFREKRNKEEVDQLEFERKNNEVLFNLDLDAFDQKQDLEKSEFDLLKKTEEEKTKFLAEQAIKRLEFFLATDKTLSDAEIETIKNTIARIKQEIGAIGEEDGEIDLFSLLGIKLDDDGKKAISDSVNFAIGQVRALLAARVQAADQAVQAADREVSSAQSLLDSQRRSREQGFANNVIQAEKQLELARRTQDKALKDREKAQRAQQRIDTILQASSLITAAANIFKDVPFPFSLAAVATMFGAFAAAKIEASTATSEQFGDGDYRVMEGGSHASGNDIFIGSQGGKSQYMEGGEGRAIISRRSVKKYGSTVPDIINSINEGTLEQTLNAMIPRPDNSMVFNPTIEGTDTRKMEGYLSSIEKNGAAKWSVDHLGRRVQHITKNKKRTYVR